MMIPKLDIKKAEKYTNLADPYAYLRDSYKSEVTGCSAKSKQSS